jgi:hypothetical protein
MPWTERHFNRLTTLNKSEEYTEPGGVHMKWALTTAKEEEVDYMVLLDKPLEVYEGPCMRCGQSYAPPLF